MEPNVVAIVILVVLAGGTVALLSWQRPHRSQIPGLRGLSMAGAGRADEPLLGESGIAATVDIVAEPSALAPRTAAIGNDGAALAPRGSLDNVLVLDPARIDPVPALSPLLTERLDRFEAQLATLQNALEQQQARIVQLAAEMHRRADAGEQRQELILERIRADLNAAASRIVTERQPQPGRERRLDVSADLYARLARLEASLSAVTNPVLLPGEPYEAPGELVTEALIWENWNEVGELVFALADAYSSQRVHLSEQARADIGGFVTALRMLLTRSIYPNLHTDLEPAQQAELQSYLGQAAVELNNLRAALDREYQSALATST